MKFGRETRLTRSSEFLAVKKSGERIRVGSVGAGWRISATERPSRLGLAVKRGSTGAVGRNRSRRVLRESFRNSLRDGEFPSSVDVVMTLRGSAHSALGRDARRALAMIAKRVEA